MSKHTPGPWETVHLGEAHWAETNHRWGIYSQTSRVAKVEGTGPESRANARLISKSPEMHELLKRFTTNTDPRNVERARALLGELDS